MTEFFKNSESFGMKFRKFHNHVYESCRSADVKPIQISSVMIKILEKLPITHLPELRLKTDSYVGNVR